MFGIILIFFSVVVIVLSISVFTASLNTAEKKKITKNSKLEQDIRVLNSTIVTLKTDYEKEISYLRDRVQAAEMNLPFPTVEKYEKEMNEYFIKVQQHYEKDNSGSQE